MAIEIVDCPIKNGGSVHSYVNVYQRVHRVHTCCSKERCHLLLTWFPTALTMSPFRIVCQESLACFLESPYASFCEDYLNILLNAAAHSMAFRRIGSFRRITLVHNVNPGLINHGLLIKGVLLQ